MSNDRSFLRHELLNLITLVGFAVSDAKLPEKKEEEISEQLKLIGLLVARQELLLGKEKKFSRDSIQVEEMLELVRLILERRFKKKKVTVTISPTELSFKGDFKVFKEGLEQLLLAVLRLSKTIEISVDEAARKISICYNSAKKLSGGRAHPLEYLRQKRSDREVIFRLSMHLMEMTGIETSFKKGLVEVVVPG